MGQKYFHTWSVHASILLFLKLFCIPVSCKDLTWKSSHINIPHLRINMNLTVFPLLDNVDSEMYYPVGGSLSFFFFLTFLKTYFRWGRSMVERIHFCDNQHVMQSHV